MNSRISSFRIGVAAFIALMALQVLSCTSSQRSSAPVVDSTNPPGNDDDPSGSDGPPSNSQPPPTPKFAPRVLMVVANDGFFFQEYFDPRKVLEDGGALITVASGLGGIATPHAGSYHEQKNPANRFASGVVPQDEIDRSIANTDTLALMSADNFDALVIVGGWGASRYYFAYPGEFESSVSQWGPVLAQASEMNRLIGEFLNSNKKILGVCNGVNVLSWARVNSVSPLQGKTVSAPWGAAPSQSYPDPYPSGALTAYTSSYSIDSSCPSEPTSNCFPMEKFARDNGASISDPQNTRSNPQSFARDTTFSEDGVIITAQDNFSAKAAAERLLQRLSEP